MIVHGLSSLPPVAQPLFNDSYSSPELLNVTTPSPALHTEVSASSLHFSLWVIIVMSLTCLFTIAFILCGLFKRADAYRLPLTADGDIDIASADGFAMHGDGDLFGVSATGTGWV
uniref:Transmembrane protein n=1 Tax=Mesocestoides corti TaxID=53468 RepID=A0A5K3EWG2_MESCO